MSFRPLVVCLLLACSVQAEFRAAVVKVDITPSTPQWLMGYAARLSTGVHDPLFHRIVALDDGTMQVFVISSDFCVFSPSVYDEVTAELQRQTGIRREQVWWTVTHTHSAPELGPPGVYDVLLKGRSDHPWNREYLAFVQAKLLEGVREARAKLQPARLAIGTGRANANINRRAVDLDGAVSLGMNPDRPADRQIGVIRLEHADGRPMALIANYAMHATVLGGRWMQISADAPGVVAAYVEEKLGGVPMLYINGAAGNLAPIYTVMDSPKAGHLGEFRLLLGDKILAAHRAMASGTAEVRLRASEQWIETPRKAELGWPEELPRYVNAANGNIRIPVRYLQLGDAVLWGAPVELFCEIAMQIREQSPFRHTFYFGYTNGWLGYLPTAAAFEEGGYEPRTSPFTPKVEADLTNGVLTHLQGLAHK